MAEPTAPTVVVDARRDVVGVSGADATGFLQGQLSQDVAGLPAGGSTWSWLLAPNGKVDALLRVVRLDDDRWLLDTDAGWGAAVAARLTRFKLRTAVDVEVRPDWEAVGLRGPAAAALAGGAPVGAGVVVADASWPGLPGVDVLGPGARAALAAAGVLDGLEAADGEELRIGAGVPAMGAELDERTIPAETGLVGRTVSFTKGCYTGQELVARIDSRGSHVPRRLVAMHPAGPVAAGTALARPDGGDGGVLTSVATRPDGTRVALGYARRAVEAGAALTAPDGTEVTVSELDRPWVTG